jgi:hypothetical protein
MRPMRRLSDRTRSTRPSPLTDFERLGDAVHLIRLGARAGLVTQLTGIGKATANRLHRELRARPSPPGQYPLTDAWYLRGHRRLLHANLVWRLYRRFECQGRTHTQCLIKTYESYLALVSEPLIDFTRAAFVPKLVAQGGWGEYVCAVCATAALAPTNNLATLCPGCRRYQQLRCLRCGAARTGNRVAKWPHRCPACPSS